MLYLSLQDAEALMGQRLPVVPFILMLFVLENREAGFIINLKFSRGVKNEYSLVC